MNRCYLELKATSAGVSSETLISRPSGIVGRGQMFDQSCPLRRSEKNLSSAGCI